MLEPWVMGGRRIRLNSVYLHIIHIFYIIMTPWLYFYDRIASPPSSWGERERGRSLTCCLPPSVLPGTLAPGTILCINGEAWRTLAMLAGKTKLTTPPPPPTPPHQLCQHDWGSVCLHVVPVCSCCVDGCCYKLTPDIIIYVALCCVVLCSHAMCVYSHLSTKMPVPVSTETQSMDPGAMPLDAWLRIIL